MILAFLAPLFSRLGIAQRFHAVAAYIGLALLVIALVWLWLRNHDAEVIERHEAKVQATVDAKDDAGDQAARDEAAATKADVAGKNAKASEAAKFSDDPLKAALDALK